MQDSPAQQPVSIHADRGAGRLDIEWRDGHRTQLRRGDPALALPVRVLPRRGRPAGLSRQPPELTSEQTRLVDMHLVGQYAIAPEWGDGHHTGYYTYALLRDRCPCPEDTARRTAAPATTAPTRSHHGGR